jgi:hypothetical protein
LRHRQRHREYGREQPDQQKSAAYDHDMHHAEDWLFIRRLGDKSGKREFRHNGDIRDADGRHHRLCGMACIMYDRPACRDREQCLRRQQRIWLRRAYRGLWQYVFVKLLHSMHKYSNGLRQYPDNSLYPRRRNQQQFVRMPLDGCCGWRSGRQVCVQQWHYVGKLQQRLRGR